jgi:hypothetical protein
MGPRPSTLLRTPRARVEGRERARRGCRGAAPPGWKKGSVAVAVNTLVVSNGINGLTGQYDLPPLEIDDLASLIKGTAAEETPDHVVERGRRLAEPAFHRGLPWGVEPHDLTRAGWAVVFHRDESSLVREALRPLLEHRRRQIGDDARVKELTYHPGESATGWLKRHGTAWSNIEPTRVPYYLLWVGSPERMPFTVTHEIDSEYCVGLLDFAAPEEYARYAHSVIAYETADGVGNVREAVFFGPRHLGDAATALSADWLLGPLVHGMPQSGLTSAEPPLAGQLGFRDRSFLGPAATRQALESVFAGPTPALLFTAGHGMVWPNGHPNQLPAQGALLCQDWPGIGQIKPEHYFAAADLPDGAQVGGLITFHFACYGAGTPARDLYQFKRGEAPGPIAPEAFTAALPRRLLSHPSGGALACIGHVERAWGYSITGGTSAPHIRTFQRALATLLVGRPAGVAVQEFNDLSSTLSEVLTRLLGDAFHGLPVNNAELVSTWTHRNDAAGFVLLGDPAVRLRVNDLV